MWDQSFVHNTENMFSDSNTSYELWTTAVVGRMNSYKYINEWAKIPPQQCKKSLTENLNLLLLKVFLKATESGAVLVFLHSALWLSFC